MTACLADIHDVALLDLDGVVYIGDDAVPAAVDALAEARLRGMRLAFVTNNAGRAPEVVAAHLCELGVPASAQEVVTSAQAGAALLADVLPAGSTVLAVGGPGVALALQRVGLVPLPSEALPGEVSGPRPLGVLQGFGRDVGWRDLAAAALAVQQGARWIVTNPDRSLPVPGGRAPGNGALAAAVEAAVGHGPADVAGKPYPALMRASLERTAAQRPLVVGDRLDTDIAGAAAVDVPSLLVMTGVSDAHAVLAALPGQRPDYLGADLRALVRPGLPTAGADVRREHDVPPVEGAARLEAGWWVCDGGRARVVAGCLEVGFDLHDDWLAGLRAGCAAAWTSPSPPDVAGAAATIESARRTVGL